MSVAKYVFFSILSALLVLVIIVVSMMMGYEVGFSWEKKELYTRRPAQVTAPDIATSLTFGHDKFRDLVSRELPRQSLYHVDHVVTYILHSLDQKRGTLVLEVLGKGSLRNPGSTDLEIPLTMTWGNVVEKPWCKVNGKSLSPDVYQEQGDLTIVNFGHLKIPAGEIRYVEQGVRIRVSLPYLTPDLLAVPALQRTVSIRARNEISNALQFNVFAIFDARFLTGPTRRGLPGEFTEHSWASADTALFPYQGFFIKILRRARF